MAMKKSALLAIVVSFLAESSLFAQTAEQSTASQAAARVRTVTARAISGVTLLPYCVDMAWQVPLGGRVGWITASVANPDVLAADARVFLLRGTGTVFSPGFGEICTRLRRAGIWTEDLGPAGDGWVCRQLIAEHRAGRLQGPIILVGHSRGARHAVDAARELEKAGMGVDLLVCLDVSLPPTVPANVRQALNVYMSQHRLYPADPLRPAPGAAVRIENVDLSSPGAPGTGRALCHVTIAASDAVQDLIVARIWQVVRETPRS
jgi:hypothetical protein